MNTDLLEACPQCDLLMKVEPLTIGTNGHCPRCGCLLFFPRKNSIARTFSYSLTGLILFVPANVLPMVGIKILGVHKDGTLWTGVEALFAEGMWGLAILVFLASIFFPLLKIVLSLLVSACLLFNQPSRQLTRWMRYLKHLDEWAMLEVYTLGIIVACVKLESMAELRFGFGLYAFAGLLIITGMLSSSLDEHLFWRRIDQLQKNIQNQSTNFNQLQ